MSTKGEPEKNTWSFRRAFDVTVAEGSLNGIVWWSKSYKEIRHQAQQTNQLINLTEEQLIWAWETENKWAVKNLLRKTH